MTKILVIEDEVDIRANLLDLLEAEGYDIVGADNGVTGLIGALEHQPDLILCDVMMPELDGYDVLRALRLEPETAMLPLIFLTALADKSDIRQGMTLGADDYLTKPFTRREVLQAVETRLQRQSAQQQTERTQVQTLQQEIESLRTSSAITLTF
ncbi:MAG: response regulator, partial [Leptolyngbya sp. SIO4C1]|nr:response regulator [Leptolyngbya sp. SIO4C1]